MYSRLLKLILVMAALGWGISILGVFLPWHVAISGLRGLGAGDVPNDPMLNYWMRMAGGGFTTIGVIFAAILVKPRRFSVLLPLMAYLSIAEGIVLLVSGIWLKLSPFPFSGDTSFCIFIGATLLVVYPRARREQESDSKQKKVHLTPTPPAGLQRSSFPTPGPPQQPSAPFRIP